MATMVGARTDLPLTQEGSEQARRFARTLGNAKLKAIYAGSLLRQMQTAEIIRNHFSLDFPVQEAPLSEIDYGVWEGLTQEEIQERWPEDLADWTAEAKWPKGIFGRSAEEHLFDIQNWIEQLRRFYAFGDRVVAVTSNGILRFFSTLGGQPPQKVQTGHFCELSILNDSIRIERWNIKP